MKGTKLLVEDELHHIEEAGKKLGVSNGVVYRLVSTGQLGSVRVGRRIMIPRSDLNEYLNKTYAPACR
jgi:excisionase family DNA binding protein